LRLRHILTALRFTRTRSILSTARFCRLLTVSYCFSLRLLNSLAVFDLLLLLLLCRSALGLFLAHFCLALLLLQILHLSPRILIAFCGFIRKLIDFLFAYLVHCWVAYLAQRSLVGSTLISDLEFRCFDFVRHSFRSQRLRQIFSKTGRRSSAGYNLRFVEFFRNAWRQTNLAAAPSRMDHCISQRSQQQRV
jgi:hypothetical protein